MHPFCNSVLGARTTRNSQSSAMATAALGIFPEFWELLDENPLGDFSWEGEIMKEKLTIKAKKVVGGIAEGEALVGDTELSFWGEYDPISGEVILPGHPFFKQNLSGKIPVMREIKGSLKIPLRLSPQGIL